MGDEPKRSVFDERGEELVPEDDAIIGRVFRLSLLVVLLGVLVVAVVLWWSGRQAASAVVLQKRLGDVPGLDSSLPGLPAIPFSDVTVASGVDFRHVTGGRGEKLLPETMGSGVAFLDHDGDGDQDLLLVNSMPWGGRGDITAALYRNDGRGRFEDVTAASGLDVSLYGMGVAVADYDADGDVDVYLTALGPNVLLRNDGGSFSDVTAESGVAGEPDVWSSSAGFIDHDRDGDLDLFVCNYVRWSREIDLELNFTLNGRDRAYGPPTNYEGLHPYLFRNEGDGTFRDVSQEAGVRVTNPRTGTPAAKALGVAFADLDGDGYPEIVVANDTTQNFLFHNRGDGTFEEIGAVAGMGFDAGGNATGAMGIDVADYLDAARYAVAIGNFANEMSSFYVAGEEGSLRFSDEAPGAGIGSPSRIVLSFGLFFFDADLDGRVDLLQANGHLEDAIAEVQASQRYRQPAQLFWNAGADARTTFVELPAERTGDLTRPIVGRGAAYADIDGDGDLDVVLTQSGDRPLVLRNDQRLGHHWVRVVLHGRGANRDGIGAWIELTAAGRVQRRQVMPTRSYLSQVELPVTFGLGASTLVDSLRVIWPDGTAQQVEPVQVDATLRIVQPG